MKTNSKRKGAKARNQFQSKHRLDFCTTHVPDGLFPELGFLRFKIGTCKGQWRSTPDAYEILSVINSQPGNGHFDDVLGWFEFSAKRDGKAVRILEVMNERLAKHLVEKRGFEPKLVFEKEFAADEVRARIKDRLRQLQSAKTTEEKT